MYLKTLSRQSLLKASTPYFSMSCLSVNFSCVSSSSSGKFARVDTSSNMEGNSSRASPGFSTGSMPRSRSGRCLRADRLEQRVDLAHMNAYMRDTGSRQNLPGGQPDEVADLRPNL